MSIIRIILCAVLMLFLEDVWIFSQHGHYSVLDYYSAIKDGIIPKDYYEFGVWRISIYMNMRNRN